MRKALSRVNGSYALAILSEHHHDQVALARCGSPLSVGFDERTGTFTFASDVAALLPHTSRALLLQENEVVTLDANNISSHQSLIARLHDRTCPHVVDLHCDGTRRAGPDAATSDTVTWNEIFEQPEALERALAGRIDAAGTGVHLPELDAHWPAFEHARRLVFVACGTSYHAALVARSLFVRSVIVQVERASAFLDVTAYGLRSDDVCVFLSQSGETADTLNALRRCRAANVAACVAVVNVEYSALVREADCAVLVRCGREIGVASAKAYTAQLVALFLIAARLTPDADERCAIINAVRRTPRAVQAALDCSEPWARALASRWKDEQRLLLLGRGADAATCDEAALKIKELAYVLAEGCNAGELKHGPLALVDSTMPVVMIVSDETLDVDLTQRMRVAVAQVEARAGRPVLVGVGAPSETPSHHLSLPSVGHAVVQSVVNVVPMQLLAHCWARERGLSVDRPRNLAKAVSVQ